MGANTAIFKIHYPEGKLSLLQKFQSDFNAVDPCSNYLRWSRDNAGIAVAGEDRVIKLYKVKAPTDFVSPFELVCKLEGGHSEPVNCLDISPSKTLLISSGNDCQASVFDLRKRTLL